MLWIVSSVRVEANSGSSSQAVLSNSGAKAVCQSLQCRTWGAHPRRWQAVSTARVKARKRRCSSGSRSEEHTSELQSQSNLVCRLLLEKKKQRQLPLVILNAPYAGSERAHSYSYT